MKANNKLILIALVLVAMMILALAVSIASSVKDVTDISSSENESESSKKDDSQIVDNGDDVIDILFAYDYITFNEDDEKQSVRLKEEIISYDKRKEYSYAVDNYFDKDFYCRSGDYITGTALADKCVVIEVYDISGFNGITSTESGKASVDICFNDLLRKCISFEDNLGFVTDELTINVYSDFAKTELLGSYVIDDFTIKAEGYLILFPQTGEFVGYYGTDTSRTLVRDSKFVDFYNECYEKYY